MAHLAVIYWVMWLPNFIIYVLANISQVDVPGSVPDLDYRLLYT
jgi:hypothetical protein